MEYSSQPAGIPILHHFKATTPWVIYIFCAPQNKDRTGATMKGWDMNQCIENSLN